MSLLTLLAVGAFVSWALLLFTRGGFWRADQVLVLAAHAVRAWPAVAAIIPARDEAGVIGGAVASHMAAAYPGALSVIVVDDHSADATVQAARAAARGATRPLTVVAAPPLAAGWTGKLWALNNGIDAARAVAPDAKYLLFTDADIVHDKDTLAALAAKAEGDDLALVSLMVRLDARGFWGRLLVPAFVFFFQKLYPFPLVNDERSIVAAAAGGCMLVRRDALEAAGGLHAIRGRLIDDCALARLLKRGSPRRRIWLGLTKEVRSLRDNDRLGDVWRMVERTAFTQLGHSVALLVVTLAAMTLVYVAGPVLALTAPLHGDAAAGSLGLVSWLIMAFAYRPTLRWYGEPAWRALLLPLAAALYAAMTFTSAVRHWRGAGGEWKGRSYSGLASGGQNLD